MKWIDAADLERWAETQIGRAEVARLVGRLIWATARTIYSFRFPSGDSAQIPGFDGHLIADSEGVPPYVPAGESVWEFGTDKDYLKKAEAELRNRTVNPGSINPSKCTFVFVTPRAWKRSKPTLIDWVKRKNGNGWKDVRVIDAIGLEHWLEQREAVAKDLAREIKGLAPVEGVMSVNEFWDEYAQRFNPKLTEDVILCGRKSNADELIQQLVSGAPQEIRLQADSRDEVIAFAAAAVRTAEPNTRAFLETRALVVDTKEGVRQRNASSGMVFLPRDAAVDVAGSLSCRAPTVIPLARVDKSAKSLFRPSWYELSQALKKMGFDDETAERHARGCGRSVTILERRIWRVERPRPPWSSSPGLLAALMAGAWDDAVEGDRMVLAILTGGEYEDFDSNMRPLLSDPEPMEREGSVWKVRAPVDTFVEVGSLITLRDIERLRSVAITVFGETDPALDLPMSDRPYAAVQGKKMRHSEWIRDGLATTLLQFAVLHDEARLHVTGITPQTFVSELIADLPGLRQDSRLLISLGRQLPWLIEAAPHPLLAALEHLLEGDGAGILPIFEETEGFFETSSHTHILWALEILAWDPALLDRVALDLAILARLDPGGRLVNRPIASLCSIFKPWMPQTKAPLAQRLVAIDFVVAKEPRVGWELVLSLLPARQGFGMPNPKPRLREPKTADEEILTNGVVYRTYREIVSRAIGMAHGNQERVLALIKSMDAFLLDEMERVCDEADGLLQLLSTSQQLFVWNELRHTVSMNAAYHDAQWALPAVIVGRLRSLQERLDPTDPILQIQWLFDNHYPDLDNARGADRIAAVENARRAAIRQLYDESGSPGIAELARRARFPSLVGVSAAEIFHDMAEFEGMITLAYSLSGMPDLFPMAISSVAHAKYGEDWSAKLADRAPGGLEPEQLATLLLGWSDERGAWDLADAFGPRVVQSYWSRRLAYPVRGGPTDQERAAKEYLKAGCAIAAVQALGDATKLLPGELVFRMLDGAMTEIAAADNPFRGNLAYEIGEVFDNLAARQDISQTDLAMREYAYLPLLKHRSSTLTLHRLMVSDPAFFVSVLCDVFKPASGEETEPTAEKKASARYGYELLASLLLVPGFGEHADKEELRRWVNEVRLLAAERDRAKIGDQFIGQVLAHAPADPTDTAWPHHDVRDLLEDLASEEIERGVEMGRSNMGGAHMIDPKSPASHERQRAAEARQWAGIATKSRRTSAMLKSMAEHWEWFAGALEERGRQDAMRD